MNLYFVFYITLLVLVFLYIDHVQHKRITKLLDRIMSKDLEEFAYYDKKYKMDLDAVQKAREEIRKNPDKELPQDEVEVETETGEKKKMNIEDFEEDWKD